MEKNLRNQTNSEMIHHRTIRNKMKEIKESDISLLPQKERYHEATFNSQTFEVVIHEK